MVFFNSSRVYQNTQAFERRLKLHLLVQNLLDNVLIYAKLRFQKSLDGRIINTSTTSLEDALHHRKSGQFFDFMSHLEGRAFDFSLKDFDESEVYELKVSFLNVAGHLGAWVGSDKYKTRCLIVDQNTGLTRHLHFQIGKDVALNFKD